MTLPTVVPCTAWEAVGCSTIDPSGAAISGTMLAAAQEILYVRSGRQFDQCQLILRPCRRDCFGDTWPFGDQWSQWGGGYVTPVLFAGQWFNIVCGSCDNHCSCSVVHDIILPYPVVTIDAVTIDGVDLTPLASHVQVFDHRQVVRIDGQAWPLCNDLSKPNGAVGTWTITATIGTPVPQLGKVALGELTRELVAACLNAPCRLPNNVQQIARQGITQTRFDPTELFGSGRIGLFYSDLFIGTYNPHNLPDRARAIDVERRGPKQLTWPLI